MAQIVDVNPQMGDLSQAFQLAADKERLDESGRQFDESLELKKVDLESLLGSREIQDKATQDAGDRADINTDINKDIADWHASQRQDLADDAKAEREQKREIAAAIEEDRKRRSNQDYDQATTTADQKERIFQWKAEEEAYQKNKRGQQDRGRDAVNEAAIAGDLELLDNLLDADHWEPLRGSSGEVLAGPTRGGERTSPVSPDIRAIIQNWRTAVQNPDLDLGQREALSGYFSRSLADTKRLEDSSRLVSRINDTIRAERWTMTNRFGTSSEAAASTMGTLQELTNSLNDPTTANPKEARAEFNQLLKETDDFNRKERTIKAAMETTIKLGVAMDMLLPAEVSAIATSSVLDWLRTTDDIGGSFNAGAELLKSADSVQEIAITEAKETARWQQNKTDNMQWAVENFHLTGQSLYLEDEEGNTFTNPLFGEFLGRLESSDRPVNLMNEAEVSLLFPELLEKAQRQTKVLEAGNFESLYGSPPPVSPSGTNGNAIQGPGLDGGSQLVDEQAVTSPLPTDTTTGDEGGTPHEVNEDDELGIEDLRERGALEPVPSGRTSGTFTTSKPTGLLTEMAGVFADEGMVGVRRELASKGYDPDDMPKKWLSQLNNELQKTDKWKATHAFHSSGVEEGRPLIPDWKDMNVPGTRDDSKLRDFFPQQRSIWGRKAKSFINDPHIRNSLASKGDGTGDFTADDFGRYLAERGYGTKKNLPMLNHKWRELFTEYAKDLGYTVKRDKNGMLDIIPPKPSSMPSGPSPIPADGVF